MQDKLKNYIPENAVAPVIHLLKTYPHELKIVNQRTSKHGDFRWENDKKYKITINNNLNKYQFLLTLIHEIAHLVTHLNYKKVRPHGKEWKRTFQHLMLPFLNPEIFPKELLPYIANYLKNPKASSDTDVKLALALKSFSVKSDKYFIFELEKGKEFVYKNRHFIRGDKRRTRYECLEIKTNKIYLFNQNAEVDLAKIKS